MDRLPPPHHEILRAGTATLAAVVFAGCAASVTDPAVGSRTDTVRIVDTVRLALPQYELDTIGLAFDHPVTVQADDHGLLIAGQPGLIARTDGSPVLDLGGLVPADLNFVGGLLNFLVAAGRRFVFLTTFDERVLVAEVTGARLDTLLVTSELKVQHFGGGLAWYGGRLLVGLGDGDSGDGRGQGLAGKVVAIDPATRRVERIASGLRNPWRMAIGGDTLWIADAGDRLSEEIDAVDLRSPGADFGWGIAEGTRCAGADCAKVTPPIYSYPTGPDCSTVVGGAVYRGRFWFADYCEAWVRSVDGDGVVLQHLDLDDHIVAVAQPVAGALPVIITQGGAILQVVESP